VTRRKHAARAQVDNPAMYKARAIGDLPINGERLPADGFF